MRSAFSIESAEKSVEMAVQNAEKTRNRAVATRFAPSPVRLRKPFAVSDLPFCAQIAQEVNEVGGAARFFFHTGNRFRRLHLAGFYTL
jgi:hypothetical protein